MDALLPLLTDRHVEVRSPAGQSYSVPLLPAAVHDTVMAAGASSASLSPAENTRARAALRDILLTVWPPEHATDLLHLGTEALRAVACRLLYGDPPPDHSEAPPANAPRTDFEFVCAKVLSAFPGYSLATLLAEPIPVILRLYQLAGRLDSWNALHRDFPAQVAATHGGRALKALETEARQALVPEGPPPATGSYTQEEYQESVARMEIAKHLVPHEVVAWHG